ncbi:MAG: glycosyltransferase family 4 protein [Dysgonamonadaceae bacterium]|nr:glycosyltransferase family 4 protein [Dysgonamonadaceae bacterium]
MYAYQDNMLPKYHRKAGHDVTIIAATYSRFDQKTGKVILDKCRCKNLEDGTKVIRLRPMLPLFINSHVHLFFGLRKILNQERPDLIFAHGVECPNYLYLSTYKKRHPNVKIVFDNHTDFINSMHTLITKIWAKVIVKGIIVRNLLWLSNHFYGTTPERCRILNCVYGVPLGKIDLLPMGADDEVMCLNERKLIRESIRSRYNVMEEDFLIVTGGKIDRLKNIHSLVKAVIDIKKPSIKILVFGSIVDEMKPVFNQLQSDKVIYIGWIPSKNVYQYFYAADLVAFPGLHSVMWEQAVASRVPTAFTRINGFEHININENCLFFENNTSKYYQKVLTEIFSDNSHYNKLKANADSDDANQFLYSRIANKIFDDIKET